MYCMEEELDETMKNSYEKVVETRWDARHRISEMEEKVYANAEKEE